MPPNPFENCASGRVSLPALQVEALSKRDRLGEIRIRPTASASLRDTKGGTSADDARERGGCFGAIAPSLDALRPSPRSADRVVPPLRGASPSASLTASPRATRLSPGAGNAAIKVESAAASLRAAEGGTSTDPVAKLLTEPSQMASPAEMGRRHSPETPVSEWRERLVCFRCGSRDTHMVVTGERR